MKSVPLLNDWRFGCCVPGTPYGAHTVDGFRHVVVNKTAAGGL